MGIAVNDGAAAAPVGVVASMTVPRWSLVTQLKPISHCKDAPLGE